MNLYFDNAATSFPKPEQVYDSMLNYMTQVGGNPGRGAYSSSLDANRIVYSAREAVSQFFNFDKPENVIFTLNITHSLNILLKGLIKPGWHVLTSSMEHNSVLRPLHTLKQTVSYDLDIIQADASGSINIEAFKKSIKFNTKLVVLSHVSNVTGTIQSLEEIGKICKDRDIYFIIDAAQSAGVLEVDYKKLNCNALCFTGHKSLLGPQGIGGFLIDDSLNEITSTFYEGGSGSTSASLLQPTFLPDKFEAGTLNTPAIAGLLSGITYINSIGLSSIFEKEHLLAKYFTEKINNFNFITSYGNNNSNNKTAVFSINISNFDSSNLSFLLNRDFSIMTRSGLHCAPLAHKTIGSFPSGTTRISFSSFNEISDIDILLDSIYKISKY